jgi:putative ABC transport system permease protein
MVFLPRLSVLKSIIGGMVLRVFLRYISRNMLEKKGRLVLLIFSIMLSTALLIVSLGLVQVVVNSYKEPIKNMQDGMDVAIRSKTSDPFFTLDDFSHSGLKDIEGMLDTTGVINKDDKISYAAFSGRTSYEKNIVEGSFTNSDQPDCVISQRIADEYDLKIGSKFTIAINGEKNDYTVKAITANKGIFYLDNVRSFNVIVPYDYLSKRIGADGKVNTVHAIVEGDTDDYIEAFNDKYTDVRASSMKGEVEADGTESIEAGMYFMLIIVCFICCIIIYGVFKLIITERITVIGTFMSQGATKKKIEHILLLESLLYAVLGSIFGVIVGEIGLYFVNRIASPLAEYGIYSPFEIIPSHIVIGVIFSFILSLVSAWLPVRSIRKLQVKDVILNRIEPKRKKSKCEVRYRTHHLHRINISLFPEGRKC